MGFKNVDYDMERDLGENPLVWYPAGVQPQQHENDNMIDKYIRLIIRKAQAPWSAAYGLERSN